MKSRAILFALLYGFLLQSQDLTLKYEIKMQGMPAEMAVYSEMQGVNYFKGEQCRTEIENMMFSIKTYVNNQEAIFCQDMMDQKIANFLLAHRHGLATLLYLAQLPRKDARFIGRQKDTAR